MRGVTLAIAVLCLMLGALAGAAAAQSLTWGGMEPQQGPPGTTVTVVVRLSPPVPLAQLSQAFVVFNTADHKGVVADDTQGSVDDDPANVITLTATVPPEAVSGQVDVVVVADGLPQPLSVGSPQPFQVGAAAPGSVALTWVSGEPAQGPVGTPVRVTVALDPAVPLSQLDLAVLVFNTEDGKGVVAQGGQATAHDDPTTRITLETTVPEGAVTGYVAAVVIARGLPEPLSVASPQPFQVTTGPAPQPPTLTWVSTEPNQGAVGTKVTATVSLNPPVPLSSLEHALLVFDGGDQQGLPASDVEAVAEGDPVTQLRLTGSVPADAITGPVRVVVWMSGLADPVFAVSPGPFQVGAETPPPPPPPDGPGMASVVAGNGTAGFWGEGQPAPQAQLDMPLGIAVDGSGSVFIADSRNHRVRKVTPQTMIITAAGVGEAGFGGDTGPAKQAYLNLPSAVALDAQGNLYIADAGNGRVRRMDPNGVITTVAGSGIAGTAGDGGPALAASLTSPTGLALDAAGNLYIADGPANVVRKVSPDGIITTVAGGGSDLGDNGPGTAAQLSDPQGLAVDTQGNLYIVEFSGNRVRKLAPSGIITTVAGTGQLGTSGDGGLATAAELNSPAGVQVDSAGNLYIADTDNARIRRVGPDGIIQTVVGTGEFGDSTSGPALQAQLRSPSSLAIDAAGNLFFTDGSPYSGNNRVKRVKGLAAPGLLAGAPFPGSTPPPPAVVPGDVTGDGKLDIRDVLLALQFVAGLKTPTPEQVAAGDVLKQGRLSISGVILMLRAVAGLTRL